MIHKNLRTNCLACKVAEFGTRIYVEWNLASCNQQIYIVLYTIVKKMECAIHANGTALIIMSYVPT